MKKVNIVICSCLLLLMLVGCNDKEDKLLVEQYSQSREVLVDKGEDVRSALKIFPDSLENVADMEEYQFQEKEGLFDGIYELYMLCAYDQAEFYKEQERLATIKGILGDEEKEILYDDTSFDYPVYIAAYTESEIEYAVIDRENFQIAYVFLQLVELDESHVPERYQISYTGEAMNIYFFDDDYGAKVRGK